MRIAYVLRGLMFLKSDLDAAGRKDFDKGFHLDSNLHAEFDPIIKQQRPNQRSSYWRATLDVSSLLWID